MITNYDEIISTVMFIRPFYGYHEGEKNFLKIEFYNPAMVKRAADLLLVWFVLFCINAIVPLGN